jgi:hypothetical protein
MSRVNCSSTAPELYEVVAELATTRSSCSRRLIFNVSTRTLPRTRSIATCCCESSTTSNTYDDQQQEQSVIGDTTHTPYTHSLSHSLAHSLTCRKPSQKLLMTKREMDLTPSDTLPCVLRLPVRVKSLFNALVPAYWKLMASPLFAHAMQHRAL